jgi:hypothetical protein
MSIADHFEDMSDVGFIRAYDARDARRQFQSSVALIFVLAAAAFALGVSIRFDQPAQSAPAKIEKPVIQKSQIGRFA